MKASFSLHLVFDPYLKISMTTLYRPNVWFHRRKEHRKQGRRSGMRRATILRSQRVTPILKVPFGCVVSRIQIRIEKSWERGCEKTRALDRALFSGVSLFPPFLKHELITWNSSILILGISFFSWLLVIIGDVQSCIFSFEFDVSGWVIVIK